MKHSISQTLEYDPNREKTWCVQDQPSVKLAEQGPKSVTDTDLVAILLNGTPNATDIARQLYSNAKNDLNTLSHFSIEQLTNTEGIGEKKAIALQAAFELGRRNTTVRTLVPIKSSQNVYDLMKPLLADIQHEEFWIICLNRAHKVIMKHKISQGGLSGTVVDTRIILKKCVDSLASSLICVHNHPSGNIQPSDADIKITDNIKKAAELMEIRTLDHVIISREGYFSFGDEGLMGG